MHMSVKVSWEEKNIIFLLFCATKNCPHNFCEKNSEIDVVYYPIFMIAIWWHSISIIKQAFLQTSLYNIYTLDVGCLILIFILFWGFLKCLNTPEGSLRREFIIE